MSQLCKEGSGRWSLKTGEDLFLVALSMYLPAGTVGLKGHVNVAVEQKSLGTT